MFVLEIEISTPAPRTFDAAPGRIVWTFLFLPSHNLFTQIAQTAQIHWLASALL
jgi:hypothetical protein